MDKAVSDHARNEVPMLRHVPRLIAVFLCLVVASAALPDERLPVPKDHDLEKALKIMKTSLKEDYEEATDAKGKRALARKLFVTYAKREQPAIIAAYLLEARR